jgi:hypothetical protein
MFEQAYSVPLLWGGCFCSAIFLDGIGSFGSLRTVRWLELDARHVLWRRCCRNRHYRSQCIESGLAVVPFLYGGVVHGHHWLNDHQFVDAVAVAMITPGPVVITVAFIGYLVAGIAGATAAALGMFLPVYLIVVVLAPSYQRWAKNPQQQTPFF